MKLTETKCLKASQREKLYRLPDGRGLYLVMPPKGNKRWEFRYPFMGKAKTISMGGYPEVSLEEARVKREDARKLLSQDIDPSAERKKEKLQRIKDSENTFETVATAWFDGRKDDWSEAHQANTLRALQKLYPHIGHKPFKELTSEDLLKALLDIESKGQYATAKKALQHINKVYKFACRRGIVKYSIADGLHEDLKAPRTEHNPALTKPEEVGQLMLDIESYKDIGGIEVYQAMRLLPLTFVRPSELCQAQWFEINWKEKQWTISAEKMKMGKKEKNQNLRDERHDHIIPLSRHALQILSEMRELTFKGRDSYIFPSRGNSGTPLTRGSLNKALAKLGYKNQHCSHGWRVTARTLLDEQLGFRIDWIEHQLAHKVKDPLGRAYNRTKHLKERRVMMEEYANYLNKLKEDAAASRE